jgi:hypothetical protein
MVNQTLLLIEPMLTIQHKMKILENFFENETHTNKQEQNILLEKLTDELIFSKNKSIRFLKFF